MLQDFLILTLYSASRAYLVITALRDALLMDPDIVGVGVGDVTGVADKGAVNLLVAVGFVEFLTADWLMVVLALLVLYDAEVLVGPRVQAHPDRGELGQWSEHGPA